MAIPVARVHLAMAHAALPGLLPTPPKCKMLPTPPCVVILPISWPPKPSRADAAERWDAHKTKSGSSSPTSSSSSGRSSFDGDSGGSPGRSSSCERWDSDKKKSASSSAALVSSSSRHADSEERWDVRKKLVSLSSSARSSSKRRPSSRASSIAGRWDAHKKPMAPRTDGLDDDGESSTGSNDMEYFLDMSLTRPLPESAFYAGPGFMAAGPDPSMLPMPTLLMRSVCAA